jgi:hypothetical protein
MKTKKILLWVGFAVSIIILIGLMIIFPIILKKKWIWFWLPSIIISLTWIVIGIILLINKWNSQLPQTTKIEPGTALERVKDMTVEDIDNGDNLKIVKHFIWKLGRKDHPPTPIYVILGYGTEKRQKRCFLVNLNNAEKEICPLIDAKDDEIWKNANLLADYPADLPITEKVTESLQYGVPTRTTERTIPSSAKEREELEKKEAEEKSGI